MKKKPMNRPLILGYAIRYGEITAHVLQEKFGWMERLASSGIASLERDGLLTVSRFHTTPSGHKLQVFEPTTDGRAYYVEWERETREILRVSGQTANGSAVNPNAILKKILLLIGPIDEQQLVSAIRDGGGNATVSAVSAWKRAEGTEKYRPMPEHELMALLDGLISARKSN